MTTVNDRLYQPEGSPDDFQAELEREEAIAALADEHEQDCYEDEGEAAYGRED